MINTNTIKTKKVVVDDQVTIAVTVNGKWVEDVEINSQMSETQARDYINDKYKK